MALARRRRRGSRFGSPERRTLAMGVIALGTVGAVAVGELGRLWRRQAVQEHAEGGHELFEAAAEAARESVAVAREGYREIEPYEAATFNLLSSFVVSFGLMRAVTYAIREGVPPFRNVRVAGRHVHHFVPGIVVAFLSGSAALMVTDEEWRARLAIPFGAGMGLTVDEFALLLELDDVYWTREGLLSVQVAAATASLIAATALALKIIRRGELKVLDEGPAPAGAPLAPQAFPGG